MAGDQALASLLCVEPAGQGRSALRWSLLEEWCDAIVTGDLYEDYGMPQTERSDAIEVLSALACIGLRDNQLSVRTTDLTGADGTTEACRRWILAELRARLHKLSADNPQDIGLAETTGDAQHRREAAGRGALPARGDPGVPRLALPHRRHARRGFPRAGLHPQPRARTGNALRPHPLHPQRRGVRTAGRAAQASLPTRKAAPPR
ncbi:hypothetical protein [Micromonospora kangleipakensis]|uniref:hypothetical protein n=1 Tax=Micromonospora kangleipakensis TaxID=1077942 RepID=UPI001028F8C4|nr:hypothetical protein [Micromonospora kangleipakensis]